MDVSQGRGFFFKLGNVGRKGRERELRSTIEKGDENGVCGEGVREGCNEKIMMKKKKMDR